MERTLVLLKPDCVQRRLMGQVISRFENKGLNIIAMKMLREAKVCTIPGGAFGESCNNALRISFATDLDTIERSMERMIPWLETQSS